MGCSKPNAWKPFTFSAIFSNPTNTTRCLHGPFQKHIQFSLANFCPFWSSFIQQVPPELVGNILLNLDMNSKVDVCVIRTKKRLLGFISQ